MSFNEPLEQSHCILCSMQVSKIQFYLTGSRYFNTHHLKSDYDFFTLDTLDTREFLENNGFEEIRNADYANSHRDILINKVMRHNALVRVDVQLVSNALFKHRAQGLLRQCNILGGLPKELHYLIWDTTYSILRTLDGPPK